MSFLSQYYSVLCTNHMRRVYIAAMVIVGAWGTTVVLMSFMFCIPLQGFWDHRVPAKCFSQQISFYAFGACNIVTDIIIFVLPLPAIFKLKLPRSQRYYLLGIFSIGFLYVPTPLLFFSFVGREGNMTYRNLLPASWLFQVYAFDT